MMGNVDVRRRQRRREIECEVRLVVSHNGKIMIPIPLFILYSVSHFDIEGFLF